ncbi:MAG: Bll2902 protein [uncultured Thiotrichaceae bacterium]|uniref:Bll2902 protein n=1 Tax=uncultured Thiotrichaceae bacterium TaxID=298394 RepID=A0A6S6SXA8_9GAMM|nr:MAG: Bll2902 protein [uncultured Thiotrichaceae bacterium]
MPRIKLEFPNSEGQLLAGLLETPDSGTPVKQFALFAHCFTCSKDVSAASRISRALAAKGIAVLRFDFTGLGNSDGDFANTNFSSNIQDLLAAAEKLEQDYQAPTLLIGHSLGGAAVLSAAHQLPSVKAIATIGAPATADHVQHLFQHAIPELEAAGQAEVTIGLRKFNVKKQLLDDLNAHGSAEHIAKLKAALLIFHSPVDSIVSINEAAKIYQVAMHPKSFISLDQADHLLSNKIDSEYVADTLTAWAGRYLELDAINAAGMDALKAPVVANNDVVVTEADKKFLRGLFSNSHQLLADEPLSVGGSNLGPTPYDLLLMSLGACTSMTIRMYANLKKIPVEDIDIQLSHDRIHADDCVECGDERQGKVERISRVITLKGDLTEAQRQRLLAIADRCPVHRTLESDPVITSRLSED